MKAFLLAIAFQAAPVLPAGWLEACGRGEAQACEVGEVTPDDIRWVHVSITALIRPVPDREGDVERWDVFPENRQGDCTTYVMSKRAALIALGMDPKAITIVLGEVERDGRWRRHAILEVNAGGETWILDNLEPTRLYRPATRPRPWREEARQPTARATWSQPAN